ncbi:MAG: nucleotidyltransferase family protein [Candidatus Zixiibacteriota bacterium]
MIGKPHIDIPRKKIEQFCHKRKVREFLVFGSVLRDDFRSDSDIDVIVDFEPEAKRTLFDIVSMTDELKEIFGREVDLVTKRSVEQNHNYIRRKAILSSMGVVYVS